MRVDGRLMLLLASARRAFVRSRVRDPRRDQWCACIGDVRAREEGVLRQHERCGRRGSEPSLQSCRVRLLRSHSSRRCLCHYAHMEVANYDSDDWRSDSSNDADSEAET